METAKAQAEARVKAAIALSLAGLATIVGGMTLDARLADVTRERDAARSEVQMMWRALRGAESAAAACSVQGD